MKRLLLAFANNLKMLREGKGLSLRELEEELGISKSALHQYENAMADPSFWPPPECRLLSSSAYLDISITAPRQTPIPT